MEMSLLPVFKTWEPRIVDQSWTQTDYLLATKFETQQTSDGGEVIYSTQLETFNANIPDFIALRNEWKQWNI